jgi:hypothetical protein
MEEARYNNRRRERYLQVIRTLQRTHIIVYGVLMRLSVTNNVGTPNLYTRQAMYIHGYKSVKHFKNSQQIDYATDLKPIGRETLQVFFLHISHMLW